MWLDLINDRRAELSLPVVSTTEFEGIMDKIEKEAFALAAQDGEADEVPYDDDAVCSICLNGDCENSNAILFCDSCNLPVHQVWFNVLRVNNMFLAVTAHGWVLSFAHVSGVLRCTVYSRGSVALPPLYSVTKYRSEVLSLPQQRWCVEANY